MNSHLLELGIRRALGRYRPAEVSVLPFPDLKVAYLPVPKAANTAIRSALMRSVGRPEVLAQGVHKSTKALLAPAARFFETPKDDWFIFTVVRNPTERTWSAWKNKLIDPDEIFRPLQRMGIRDRLSFEDFLAVCAGWPTWALNDHFMPQARFLAPALERPGLHVFRVEDLAEDWARVRREMADRGAPEDCTLGHENASKAKVTKEVSGRARDLLNQLYGTDYDRFGYDRP